MVSCYSKAKMPEVLPVAVSPLHSLPPQQQLNGESAHPEKGMPIFQSVLGLAGFQLYVICLLDAYSVCQLLLFR